MTEINEDPEMVDHPHNQDNHPHPHHHHHQVEGAKFIIEDSLYSSSSSSAEQVGTSSTLKSQQQQKKQKHKHKHLTTKQKPSHMRPFHRSNHDSNTDHGESDDKCHKFVKRALNKLSLSPCSQPTNFTPTSLSNSIISTTSSSSDIFERSLENNYEKIFLTNPEIPSHYNLENYTSPILDTTTEILTNPKINLDQVKLNCFCDEEDDEEGYIDVDMSSEPSMDANESHSPLSPNASLASSGLLYYKMQHVPASGGSVAPVSIESTLVQPGSSSDIHHSGSFREQPRPRARSIISQTLISTLDNSHRTRMATSLSTSAAATMGGHGNNHNLDLERRATAPGGHMRHHFLTKSFTQQHQPQLPISTKLTKRSFSFAGNTKHSRNKFIDDGNSPTIEFYSFADMINHEDLYNNLHGDEEQPTDEDYYNDDNDNDDEETETGGDMLEPRKSNNARPSIRSGSEVGTNSGGGNMIQQPPFRRSSYTTISAKDYIGVL